MAGSQLLYSEILELVHKAKTKEQKVKILKQYNTPALKAVIKSSFDPNIKWVLPEGDVPYTKNDAPAGTEHTILSQQVKKLFRFIEGGTKIRGLILFLISNILSLLKPSPNAKSLRCNKPNGLSKVSLKIGILDNLYFLNISESSSELISSDAAIMSALGIAISSTLISLRLGKFWSTTSVDSFFSSLLNFASESC